MTRLFRFVLSCTLSVVWHVATHAQCAITVNAGDDIYVCSVPDQVTINGSISGDFLSFTWTPTTGLSGFNTLQPTANVTQSVSYVLTASAADLTNNLVSNGDFESGNTDFLSDYGYSPGNLVPEGLYDVLSDPQDDHPDFSSCDDHTSGAGNMMVVNGAGTPNQNVWCQTVAVVPNAQYVLSAWVTSVVSGSPALLQFSINGNTVGPIFNAPSSVCSWQNYFQLWNSGANTSATICIVNQNTTLGGNDFALDDIVFAPTCLERDTVRIQVVNLTAVATPNISILACDGAEVTLSGAGSSTGDGITYLWETSNGNIVSGETTLSPTVNATGEYTLTVFFTAPDGTVCEKKSTINVIPNPVPLSAWINDPSPLGCGSSNTTLIGNSNQTGFSSFSWETQTGNIVSGADQKNCVVNQVGIYTLTVTNNVTGCTATAEVTVTATTTPPVANATVMDILTCFLDTIPLSSMGSSTGANITYSWTTTNGHFVSGQNTATPQVDAVGAYVLNVTNTSSNCTSRDTVQVIGNLTPPFIFLPPQQQLTCTTDTIAMIVYLNPPPFVLINWTATGGGNIVSGQFTPNPQVDAEGTYVVTVQDPINGCITTGSAFVNDNINFPIATIAPPQGITCQSPSIVLSGAGSSAGAQFGYNWTASGGGNIVSGGNTLNPTVNAAGDYTLTVIDSLNGCVTTETAIVTADTNVVTVIANAADTLDCTLLNLVLNADGSSNGADITYAWTTTDGNIVSGADTPNPLVDLPGTYQLLLTNTLNGCSGTDLAVVIQNIAPPVATIDLPAQLTCIAPDITLTAHNNDPGGSYQYNWTASNGGNITAGGNGLTPTVNAPGDYTLTTTNLATGCTASVTTTVSVAAGVPVAVANANGPITCAQSTQNLTATGSTGGLYAWTASNGGNIVGSTNSALVVANAPGTYTLVVTNPLNGCTASASVVVTRDTVSPAVLIELPIGVITCDNPQVYLQGDGTGVPTWATPDGNIVDHPFPFTSWVNEPGTYILTTTDPNNGCTASTTVQVAKDTLAPDLGVSAPSVLTCTVTNQVLSGQNNTPAGSFTYQWTASNGGNITLNDNTLSPEIDAPGDYLLTATNTQNGCTATVSTTVLQDIVLPDLQVAAVGDITCDDPTRTIQAQNNSLPGNFIYNWTAANGGAIVSGNNGLTPVINAGGDYSLVTTNQNNGCTTTILVNVVQNNTPPVANAGADATLTCNLNNLTLNGSGAPGLNYQWTAGSGGNIASGANTPTPIIDAPGVYTLTLTNPVNGCTATDVVDILNDASAPAANAGTAPELTCSLTQTALNATATTGAGFNIQWAASGGGNILSNGNTLTPTIDAPGVYTLTVTNTANGCTRSSSITVTENITPPVVEAGLTANLTCTTTSLTLQGSNTGGNAAYTWQTTGGNIVSGGNSATPVINRPGTYTLTATLSANGCTATDVVTIGIDTISPSFAITPPQLLTCDQLNTPLTGTVQQPTAGNFNATWTTANGHFVSGQNTLNALADAPGAYILTVLNTVNGCDAAQAILVFQNTTPPTAVATTPGMITCAMPSLALSGAGSSTGNNFSYTWSGGQIISGATTLSPVIGSAATYTLLIRNTSTGCTATTTVVVGSNTTPPTVAIATPGQLTCVQNSVTLNGNGSSNGAGFTPAWTTSGGGAIVSGQGSLQPVVNTPGNYQLTIQNSQNGCTATAQVQVTQNITPPGADAGTAEDLHCNQPTVMLQGSSSTGNNMQYAWATQNGNITSGNNSQTSTVDEPGTYALTVTNPQNGCTATDNVTVGAIPPPIFAPALTQPDCHDKNGTVDFGAVTGGQEPFVYSSDGGQTFGAQSLASNLPPDVYTLVVQDALGCTATQNVTINQPFTPTVSIPAVATLLVGDSVLLQPVTNISPSDIASWSWTPPDGLSCGDCATPWARPFRSANYNVVVVDENGCQATAQVQVRVNRQRDLYAPNIFSPNDDGENDRFMLYARGVKEIQSLQVFDRWGNALFLGEHLQPGDEQAGWDGTYRGDPMTPAVFVWWARVEFVDGEVEVVKGDVTLVR